MPSVSVENEAGRRTDIVIGDRFGTSAWPVLVDRLEAAIRQRGYHTARNRPYAGGFITEHYGSPTGHVHALQIEISRGLYMDEVSLQPHEGFEPLMLALSRMMAECFAQWAQLGLGQDLGPDAQGLPQAAE